MPALSLLCAVVPAAAWAAEGEDARLDTVYTIATGNRSNTLTVADSPSPIDIISGEQIRKTGKASLREALGRIVPSFSAPAQAGGARLRRFARCRFAA